MVEASFIGERIDAVVLGASGYVGGELLRILGAHPGFSVWAAASRQFSGKPWSEAHPHLLPVEAGRCFVDPETVEEAVPNDRPVAVFCAVPHGEAARIIESFLSARKAPARVVDLSADFRLGSAERFESVYGRAHGAADLMASFHCGLPDLDRSQPAAHVSHPGCFTTAVTLAARPLIATGLAEPHFFASCVTGSTGSGREPKEGTHHPARHGNLRAYSPLCHRHAEEMRTLVGGGDTDVAISFVPHSGPFSRGIHATVFGRLHDPMSAAEVAKEMATIYRETPFVAVGTRPPVLKDVVGTNVCRIGVAVDGREIVVFSVIDNLTKGAAGGAVQWMNRIWGFEEDLGLRFAGVGWS